jgi:hypothetical protein
MNRKRKKTAPISGAKGMGFRVWGIGRLEVIGKVNSVRTSEVISPLPSFREPVRVKK